jgi:hypothetical protein
LNWIKCHTLMDYLPEFYKEHKSKKSKFKTLKMYGRMKHEDETSKKSSTARKVSNKTKLTSQLSNTVDHRERSHRRSDQLPMQPKSHQHQKVRVMNFIKFILIKVFIIS